MGVFERTAFASGSTMPSKLYQKRSEPHQRYSKRAFEASRTCANSGRCSTDMESGERRSLLSAKPSTPICGDRIQMAVRWGGGRMGRQREIGREEDGVREDGILKTCSRSFQRPGVDVA